MTATMNKRNVSLCPLWLVFLHSLSLFWFRILMVLTMCLALSACWDAHPYSLPDDISTLTKDAEGGQAQAQYHLGLRYAKGTDVQKDEVIAVTWYRKAAVQGNAPAQRNLGLCYANGTGVTKDEAQAFTWYRKAAEQGEVEAQRNLGICYAAGAGTSKDIVLAATWYRKSAEQGDASAQWFLGFDYAKGIGVPKDDLLAYKWLNLSAAQGIADAAKLRDEISKTMTPAQIAEAQRLSREWKPAEGKK